LFRGEQQKGKKKEKEKRKKKRKHITRKERERREVEGIPDALACFFLYHRNPDSAWLQNGKVNEEGEGGKEGEGRRGGGVLVVSSSSSIPTLANGERREMRLHIRIEKKCRI